MGRKHLVILKPELLLPAAVPAHHADKVNAADLLAWRHTVLIDVGNYLAGVPSAVPLSGIFGEDVPSAPASESYSVLPAIGALIVDDSEVDIERVSALEGLSSHPDVDIEIPLPVATSKPFSSLEPTSKWHLAHIGEPRQLGSGAGILIGILDSGVDASHAELAGKVAHFQEFDSLGRAISSAARDAGSHGTHVCGIAAGASCGIAPQASLAVAAVLTQSTPNGRLFGGLVQIAAGYDWLVTRGVHIINVSLGTQTPNPLIGLAVNARTMGILTVAAIGNDGRHPNRHICPGSEPQVLGVGATDRFDRVADFSDWCSNYTKPNLSAPGVDVISCIPGNMYASCSGTSAAAPIISGVGALLLERNPNLRSNPTALWAELIQRASAPTSLGANSNWGGTGRITC